MSGWLGGWLVDTFVYTGLLIAGVMALRRPVSRQFGPQVAYALWALPLLRFALPPLVLPAWMAPAPKALASVTEGASAGSEPLLVLVADTATADRVVAAVAGPGTGAILSGLLLVVWLGGAALFLAWRTREYAMMRRELLVGARPVGEAGAVRLVETPAVASPVAFGVRDKVVALPPAFMALHDRSARDLAIAHELAHHRGRDLLANIVAQPLLALHWFNPLAWAGWRAMRRDQEAACDARVIAGRGRGERALYASVIAGFAAGDSQLALAAPMACRMLGEKSIIHRLRSLSAAEISAGRRRAGLLAIGAVALGLPLTASISYASPSLGELPETPAMPELPQLPEAAVPAELADPSVPSVPDFAPVPEMAARFWDTQDMHTRNEAEWQDARERSEMARQDALARQDLARENARERIERGREAREDVLQAANEAREDGRQARQEAMRYRAEALAEAEEARAAAMARQPIAMRGAPVVTNRADCGGSEPVIERRLADGRQAIIICDRAMNAEVIAALREARTEVAEDAEMPRAARDQVLRQFDTQIEQMRRDGVRESRISLWQEGAGSGPAMRAVAISFSAAFPGSFGALIGGPVGRDAAASAWAGEADDCAVAAVRYST